jgi:hypothetical protein
MSVPRHGKRGPAAPSPGGSPEGRNLTGDLEAVAGQDEAPPSGSRRLQAMLEAASPEREETPEAVESGSPPAPCEADESPDPTEAKANPVRASRNLRTAISRARDGGDPAHPVIATERTMNPAASLALRLVSMMGVVIAGVFIARLFDFALGLQTRLQGLGILAVYLVVLAVILAPGLNPQTRKQWTVVICGFAGVIVAIAMGSAFARLMLQSKDFQGAGLYVEIVVEFGVMFAFWGLAVLAFVRVLRGVGLGIGTESESSGQSP